MEDEKKNKFVPNGTSGGKYEYVFEFEQYSWDQHLNTKCDLINNAKNKIECERKKIDKFNKIKVLFEQEKLRQTHLLNVLLQTKEDTMNKLKIEPNT